MPMIQVHAIENVFTEAQKREVIEKLTDAMVSVEGEALRGVTWVTFAEVPSGCWGVGGKTLTTDAVREMQRTG